MKKMVKIMVAFFTVMLCVSMTEVKGQTYEYAGIAFTWESSPGWYMPPIDTTVIKEEFVEYSKDGSYGPPWLNEVEMGAYRIRKVGSNEEYLCSIINDYFFDYGKEDSGDYIIVYYFYQHMRPAGILYIYT